MQAYHHFQQIYVTCSLFHFRDDLLKSALDPTLAKENSLVLNRKWSHGLAVIQIVSVNSPCVFFFFRFSALWQVQTSNGSTFLDVELLLYVCCIPRSSSSPVIFVLVFPFLFYPPFFLLLFIFEVSPLSLYVPSSSVVSFLLSSVCANAYLISISQIISISQTAKANLISTV